MPNLDFTSSHMLIASLKQVTPELTFFKDRYFPTGAGDIFATDDVLIEYKKQGQKVAPFVAPRVGDIDVSREGYSISKFAPAKIAISRSLRIDDLTKRGFGEALYSTDTPEQRAARMQVEDMTELDRMIVRREEILAAQTMINNACTMVEYVDAKTEGDTKYIAYFDTVSEHTYTVSGSAKWGTANANIRADIRNMCKMLAKRGLSATDLILGTDAYEAVYADEKLREELNRNSGITVGTIDENALNHGVTFAGVLNFGGYKLNVFCVDEEYINDEGEAEKLFPAKSAMVTFPGCGHTMYGAVTQLSGEGTAKEFETVAGKRVPKVLVNDNDDVRKLRLTSRPLTVPKDYCPYIYAAEVC